MQQDIADRLERMLTNSAAFKPFFKKFFNGAQAAEAYRVYTDSEYRGVYVNHLLRVVTMGNDNYSIMVFRASEDISSEELAAMKSKAAEIPPGMARAEAVWFRNMEQWVGPQRDFSQIQQAIGGSGTDTWAYVAAYTKEDYPIVVYAKKGDTVSLLPVSVSMVDKLGLNKPLVSKNEGLY